MAEIGRGQLLRSRAQRLAQSHLKGSRNHPEKTALWEWGNAGTCARSVLAYHLVLHRSEWCSGDGGDI